MQQPQTPYVIYSSAVKKDPRDFSSWVQLLSLVETETTTDVQVVRETFSQFLEEFPLCFGYWNKVRHYLLLFYRFLTLNDQYAHYEIKRSYPPAKVDRMEALNKARNVYERGVVAVRYSVDMWVNYLEFMINTVKVKADEGRKLLEQGIEACGTNPSAGPIWDLYILFETTNNDMYRLNAVFKRIFTHPLNNLGAFWEKYNQFSITQRLSTLATSKELDALAAEGEENDESALRVKLSSSVEQLKLATEVEIRKRYEFESKIDRTYYHVAPVPETTLENWRAYLNFEETHGTLESIEKLYERCLVVCADYAEFWTRYALWTECKLGFEAACATFERPITVFLKYSGEIYLQYAYLLEAHDQLDEARAVYKKVLDIVDPKLAKGFVDYANFERRQGNLKAAETLYQDALEKATTSDLGFVAIRYAAFQHQTLQDTETARQTFAKAADVASESKDLWQSYAAFELSQTGNDMVQRVNDVYASALSDSSRLSSVDKCSLWVEYEAFLHQHGPSMKSLRAVMKDEHSWRKDRSISRKRERTSSLNDVASVKKTQVVASVNSNVSYQQAAYSTVQTYSQPTASNPHYNYYYQQQY